MDLTTGLILVALGAAVWIFGNRMWLLGAGAGALLGFALIQLFPSLGEGTLGLIIVIGAAIVLGVVGFMGKAMVSLIAMILGFVIGGALALSLLGMLGMSLGALGWIIALVVGLIVGGLFGRFLDWAMIIFASLLGSMLMVQGGIEAFPDLLTGTVGSVVVLVLTIIGIYYHYRRENPSDTTAA